MTAPVVDHVKRSTIQEITSKSPFNIFNIVAIVAILVIGYFLYRKFTDKFQKGAIKIPPILPMGPPNDQETEPVIVETMAAPEPDAKED